MEIRQSWLQLIMIQIGCVICIPMIFVGFMLGRSYGLLQSAFSIFIGNALLLPLGLIFVEAAVRYRMPVILLVQKILGRSGALLLGAALGCSMVGWFALQVAFVAEHVQVLFPFLDNFFVPLVMVLGCCMALSVVRGIVALAYFSAITTPLLVIFLVMALYNATCCMVYQPVCLEAFSCVGISLVIAAALAAMVDAPTFYQFARSRKDGVIAMMLLCVVVIPAVEMIGVILAQVPHVCSLLDALSANYSMSYRILITLFLILAGWTTNAGNLFSAVVNTSLFFPSVSFATRVMIIGLLATLTAACGIAHAFESVLVCMSMLVMSSGCVVAIFLLNEWYGFSVISSKRSFFACISALLGFIIGCSMVAFGTSFFAVPVIDAAIIAGFSALLSILGMIIYGA